MAGISFQYEFVEELGDEHYLGCKCCRFKQGVDLPIPRLLEFDETNKAARRFAEEIFGSHTQLSAVVERFESVIQKRWMKKNMNQRRELLLKAWPDMSPGHRPDYAHFRSFRKQATRSRTCHSAAFLWPYINLEDLLQRHHLLLFINSRARNKPTVFRNADVSNAHLGRGWVRDIETTEREIKESCCDDHARYWMLFQHTDTPDGYGEVIDPFKGGLKDSQIKYLCSSFEGLLALEIQNGIYPFLLACTKLILHDIDEQTTLLAPPPPEPTIRVPSLGTERTSLGIHVLEAPYRVPQRVDLDRLIKLVGGHVSAAEDHIWLLKEDPAYFSEQLTEWLEHDEGFALEKGKEKDVYTAVTATMIGDAYTCFLAWHEIHKKLRQMPAIDVQTGRTRKEKGRLSERDEERWSALTQCIQFLLLFLITRFEGSYPVSPRLRHRFERDVDGEWILKSRSSEPEERVSRLFLAMTDDRLRFIHGGSSLVDEMQYLLETDAEASQYVDSWMARIFSDIALLTQLSKSVDGMAPYLDVSKALTQQHMMSEVVRSLLREVASYTELLPRVIGQACAASDIIGWNPMVKSDLHYPADKRSTKANIDQMRSAERHLDSFWWTLEERVESLTNGKWSLDTILEQRQSRPRHIHRTPAWKPTSLITSKATPKTNVLQETDANSLGRFYETPAARKFDPATSKDKIKTRGTPAVVGPRAADFHGPLEEPNPQPVQLSEPELVEKAKIPKKAYRVWCTLLPGAALAEHLREISWDDLVAAFNALGFESEKLYGSVWSFTPRAGDHAKVKVSRPIQFHEPKEVRRGHKISKLLVRTFGRRLKHAYGWTDAKELFECE